MVKQGSDKSQSQIRFLVRPHMPNFEELPTKEKSTEVPPEKVEILAPLSEKETASFNPNKLRKELDELVDEFNRIDMERAKWHEHMFGPVTEDGMQRVERQKEITKRVKEIAEKLGIKVDVKI